MLHSAIELYNLNHVASLLQKDKNSERINKGFVDCPRLFESYGNTFRVYDLK